jgi:hypothetical protein
MFSSLDVPFCLAIAKGSQLTAASLSASGLGRVKTPALGSCAEIRTSRCRACAAFTQSPYFSSVARAASSAFGGQPRSRDTSADLGLGDDTPRAGHGLSTTEGACRALQESLRAYEIAELSHRDTAKREGRRVITQANPFQYAEEVTRGECSCRSLDQRVHRSSATLTYGPLALPRIVGFKCFAQAVEVFYELLNLFVLQTGSIVDAAHPGHLPAHPRFQRAAPGCPSRSSTRPRLRPTPQLNWQTISPSRS